LRPPWREWGRRREDRSLRARRTAADWAIPGRGCLLFGYGLFLNLAPLEFGQVVGLYIATLFVVWQSVNFVFFRSVPTLPIVVGGTLVIAGGMIITFWRFEGS
jgi:hypothetical protein